MRHVHALPCSPAVRAGPSAQCAVPYHHGRMQGALGFGVKKRMQAAGALLASMYRPGGEMRLTAGAPADAHTKKLIQARAHALYAMQVVTKVHEDRPETPGLSGEASGAFPGSTFSDATIHVSYQGLESGGGFPGSSGGASTPSSRLGSAIGGRRGMLGSQSRKLMRRVEVAVLGPGDLCGEATLLGLERHTTGGLLFVCRLQHAGLCACPAAWLAAAPMCVHF